MHRLVVVFALAVVVVSCKPEEETTGSVNKCATELFTSYNPKSLDQCVAACRTCDHGTTTTCTTSCTLKGAR
jgi:PBP1b-binding outer membrane lipoprotein LpoB